MLLSLNKKILFSFLVFWPNFIFASHDNLSKLIEMYEMNQLKEMASRDLTDFEYKRALMNSNFYSAACEKHVIIILGGPGSGKSFFMENLDQILSEFKLLNGFNSSRYLIVDSQFFREVHHGFNNYLSSLGAYLGSEDSGHKEMLRQLKPIKKWKKNAKKRMLDEAPLGINLILGKSKKSLKECIHMLQLRTYRKIWFIGLAVPWEIAQNRGFERTRPYRGTVESHDDDIGLVNSIKDQTQFIQNLSTFLDIEEDELNELIGRRTIFTNTNEPELIYDSGI